MTREEALKILKSWDGYMFLEREEGHVGYSYKKDVSQEAINVAIEALEQLEERPQGEPIIKCQDCKYRVKEWREDKRMKDKGYWVYGCEHFGEIMGYWGFGGNDNEFCSDAEMKGGVE